MCVWGGEGLREFVGEIFFSGKKKGAGKKEGGVEEVERGEGGRGGFWGKSDIENHFWLLDFFLGFVARIAIFRLVQC